MCKPGSRALRLAWCGMHLSLTCLDTSSLFGVGGVLDFLFALFVVPSGHERDQYTLLFAKMAGLSFVSATIIIVFLSIIIVGGIIPIVVVLS